MSACDYVADASRCLLTKGFQPQSIDEALGILGRGAGIDRVYVFEDEILFGSGERLTSQRFEWAAPGITPQIDDPACQRLPYSVFGRERANALCRGEIVRAVTRQTPPGEFRAILEGQGIRSLLLCPIVCNATTWGFVGFDDCHREREWPPEEVAALRTFARAMTGALRQAELREALGRARRELQKVL